MADRVVSALGVLPRAEERYIEADRETGPSPGGQITSLLAENTELKGQIEQLRAERTRWTETQRRLMELLHTNAPEKLLHDLRNLLNERDLLKTLVDSM